MKDTAEEEGVGSEGRREIEKRREGGRDEPNGCQSSTMARIALNVVECERIAFHQRAGTLVISP